MWRRLSGVGRRVAPVLVVFALGMAAAPLWTALGAPARQAPVFETPEAAIEHYLAGVAAADLAMIFEAVADEEMAAGYDFVGMAERLNAVMLAQSMGPSEDPLFEEMNRMYVQNRVAGQVRALAYGLLTGITEDDYSRVQVLSDNPEMPEAFVEAADSSRLESLRLLETADPTLPYADSAAARRSARANARIHGARDWTERVALIDFEGNTYVVGFQFLRYGDQWLVMSQNSAYAGTSSFGMAVPLTAGEWDDLVNSEPIAPAPPAPEAP